MAKVIYKSYNQNDGMLFPPFIGDMIPANHKVRVVNAIIEKLDIRDIEESYKGGGTSSYSPRMLLKVIVYGYLNNIYSGRKIAVAVEENINFMWLAGMSRPDFRTINIFRSVRLKDRFDGIFTQIVELLHEAGMISLDVQYIDGTKIEANANKYSFVWKRSTETNKSKLGHKIQSVLEEAEHVLACENAESDSDGSDMTASERVDKILSRMEEKGMSAGPIGKAVKEVKEKMLPKMKEYDAKLETLGERNSYSKTDKDATFMRMKEDAMNNGQTKPGYNVQISTENQFITNYGLYWRPTDWGTMIPYLKTFSDRFGAQSKEIVADSGYGSEQNYEYMFDNGMTPYVKYNMFHAEMKRKIKDNPFLPQNMFYNEKGNYYVCPAGQHLAHIYDFKMKSDLGYESTKSVYRARNCRNCPMRGLCYKAKKGQREIEVNHRNDAYRAAARELLTSEKGLHHRSMRPIEPEAVFGQIKFDHHFKRFLLRSKAKVITEFGLVAFAHNIRKYIAVIENKRMAPAIG